MSNYTESINNDYQIPNITVYNKYCDGEHYAFRVAPDDGYVMYDKTADDYEQQVDAEFNPMFDDNGEPIYEKVTYYYRQSNVPLSRPGRPYDWEAVLESSVNDKYIF